MYRIVLAHGLVPVPVELDPLTLAPADGALERAMAVAVGGGAAEGGGDTETGAPSAAATSPGVVAIVVAHVFGGRMDMTPILTFAAGE